MARRQARASSRHDVVVVGEIVEDDENLPVISAAHGVKFNKQSLFIPANLKLKDWIELGQSLGRLDRAVQWYIGDWWAYGEHSYGDRLDVVSAPDWTGPSFKTCANTATVSRAFETSRRREVLSFTHHAEVAGLDRKLADRLLDQHVRMAKANDGVPPPSRELRLEVKRRRREERANGDDTDDDSKALGGRKYPVIYADPWAEENGAISIRKIADLAVPAAKNATLFLWRKAQMMAQAEALMDAWGFEYKTEFVWVKPRAAADGNGDWNNPRHEVLMVGVRGYVPVPAVREQFDSVISAPAGKDHQKPTIFQEMIDTMFPNSRGLEMFARSSGRPGWDTWGNAEPVDG